MTIDLRVIDMTLEERLDMWQRKWGPIPEDATHFDMLDGILEVDMKKVDGDVVYWRHEGKWVDSQLNADELGMHMPLGEN